MNRPAIIITGASGFVGRHLIQALRDDLQVYAVARRSQPRSGIADHPRVEWFQADIGEQPQIDAAFRAIREHGGADTVVHLAAHYDFTGVEDNEYWRTNVIGLRHVLDAATAYGVRHFVFASSILACRAPRTGRTITEESPPHGRHVFAATKREGEALMFEYSDRLHPVIVRIAPLFSDWCEYPPLFVSLQTWHDAVWNGRMLEGHGRTAVPYLHVNDLVLFLLQLLARLDECRPSEVLIASPDGATSQKDLFAAATMAFFGARREPIFVPRAVCGPLVRARNLVGRLTGNRPFDRPWMTEFIDTAMTVDASRTRLRIDWAPRPRLEILRRLPFLVENMKSDPVTWAERNRAAMKAVHVPTNLKIHWLLEQHQNTVVNEYAEVLLGSGASDRFARYQAMTRGQIEWHTRLIYRSLLNAVRTHDKGVFMGYCRDLAEQRLKEGFSANELCGALEALNLVCWRVLRRDPESAGMREALSDYVTSTLRSGCDQAQEVFELDEARRLRAAVAQDGPK
jgi:nucleoside-diphosphate-sugar epimerase